MEAIVYFNLGAMVLRYDSQLLEMIDNLPRRNV